MLCGNKMFHMIMIVLQARNYFLNAFRVIWKIQFYFKQHVGKLSVDIKTVSKHFNFQKYAYVQAVWGICINHVKHENVRIESFSKSKSNNIIPQHKTRQQRNKKMEFNQISSLFHTSHSATSNETKNISDIYWKIENTDVES